MAAEKSSKNKPQITAAERTATEKGVPDSLLEKHVPSLTRFKLPKFFAPGEEGGEESDEDDDAGQMSATAFVAVAPGQNPAAGAARSNTQNTEISVVAEGEVASELSDLRSEIQRLTEQVSYINERESSLERVFDTLHAELADYKNDFLYEHLKPVVRPLLFLFDSLEQFDSEVSMAEATMNANAQGGILSPQGVRDNVQYFRDQLTEALRVCEVTIMDTPTGPFNPRLHKAIDVMPVPSEQDGTVVRAVRSGWFLNGQLLRPAEVVVGKFRPSP
jgi:molecular chaperone GrpE (heat shock protein)